MRKITDCTYQILTETFFLLLSIETRKKCNFVTENKTKMKNYLLGIGIDVYESIPETHYLNNAVRDTKTICEILSSKYGFEEAKYLINSEATNEKLHQAFNAFHKQITEEDNLLIYYAGHGYINDNTDIGYWLPYDAQSNKTSTYFLNSTLIDYVKHFDAKHIVLISDSCFSRTILLDADNKTPDRSLYDYERQKSRWAITSGREYVSDGKKGGHSPFAESIIEFLNEQNKDFLVSDLIQHLKKISYNSDQNPQGSPLANVGHKGGEYIFKPNSIKRKRVKDDELRGYSDIAKILQLYQPKSQFKEYSKVEDKTKKIGYSLFTRENKPFNTVEYYLYLYKGINQTATHVLLRKKCPNVFKTKNFTILIPREEEQKNQEKRKSNIRDKFKSTSIFYIDEFIWNLCTPTNFTEITTDSKFLDINNFVTPRVVDEKKEEKSFNDLIDWLSLSNEQVLVLRGGGGIGKTTIAKYIADTFQGTNKQKKALFIESSEIIDELKRARSTDQELNIYNFYEAFYEADHSKNGYLQDKLNNDLFRVNLDNGNLLIVIDGLDEIISKVPNFDVNVFLRSISDSYSEIGNAKVIITCRTYFWDNSKIDEYSLKLFELLPFDELQARNFFDKSFNDGNKKTDKCIKIAKTFVSQPQDNKNYEFQPYVLDVIKNIVDSDNELLTEDYSFNSKYLIQNIKSDYIIHNVCQREMRRINQISVNKQIEFFMTLSVKYDGVIAGSKFADLVESSKMIDPTKIEALKSHPFIITTSTNKIFIKYDFLTDIFKGLYLKSLLDINNQETISADIANFIANNCSLNSNLLKEVVDRSKELFDDEILKIVETIEHIQKMNISNMLKNKSISGLFALALRINHRHKGDNIESNTTLLDDLFCQNNEIRNLSMINFSSYEYSIRFDFSDKTFIECYIDNFSDFWTCKFNNNTRFIDCTLYNLQNDSDIPINVKENQFQSCTKDSSINEVFINSELKEQNIETKILKFLDSFFNLFFTKGKLERQSYDANIKHNIRVQYTKIRPNLFKLEKLIKVLESNNVIIDYIDETFKDRKLKISDDYKMDVTKFCKEGTVSTKIKEIIRILVENLS